MNIKILIFFIRSRVIRAFWKKKNDSFATLYILAPILAPLVTPIFEILPFPVPYSHGDNLWDIFCTAQVEGIFIRHLTGGYFRTSEQRYMSCPRSITINRFSPSCSLLNLVPTFRRNLYVYFFFCFSAARFHFTSLTDLGRWEGLWAGNQMWCRAIDYASTRVRKLRFVKRNQSDRTCFTDIPVGLVKLHWYGDWITSQATRIPKLRKTLFFSNDNPSLIFTVFCNSIFIYIFKIFILLIWKKI